MTVLGMDIDAAQTMAAQFGTQSDNLKQVGATLGAALQNVQWTGSDQVKFLSDWQSIHLANINKLCEDLTQAQSSLTSQVAQQQQASGS